MSAHPPSRPSGTRRSNRSRRRLFAGLISLLLLGAAAAIAMPAAYAASYVNINGDGSSWAYNAINQWTVDVKSEGVTVGYTPDGSSTGRKNFASGLSDYAVSEIPYTGDTSDPQDSLQPSFPYSLLPVVAGGTSFMYNLPVNGTRYTQLKLSQAALAGIFSGQITTWNDPAIAATNPGVNLPAQQITVVVRSDGSGATAQFTLWMLRQFPAAYQALCNVTKCNPASATSYYPVQGLPNFVGQSQSLGVTSYVASTPYTINYDEYSYAQQVNFPVVQLQNAAGYFQTPTSTAVAVALTQAQINGDQSSKNYLSQDLSSVYAYGDPRTYPISAYSYLIVPLATENKFDASHGSTLAYFATHDLCQGQQTMGSLGYSPLPMNLVLAAMNQVLKIPGIDAATQSVISSTQGGLAAGATNPCNNPTFQPGDDPAHNILIDKAPFPAGCDATCQAPWVTSAAATNGGTGGKTGGVKGGKGKVKGPKTTTDPSTGVVVIVPVTGDGTAVSSTGTDATTSTTTDPAAAPATGAVASSASAPVCDADTGLCASADATTADPATTSSAAITPTSAVIPGEGVWGGPQLAIAICVLLGLLLVVGPAIMSNQLERRRRAPATRSREPGNPS